MCEKSLNSMRSQPIFGQRHPTLCQLKWQMPDDLIQKTCSVCGLLNRMTRSTWNGALISGFYDSSNTLQKLLYLNRSFKHMKWVSISTLSCASLENDELYCFDHLWLAGWFESSTHLWFKFGEFWMAFNSVLVCVDYFESLWIVLSYLPELWIASVHFILLLASAQFTFLQLFTWVVMLSHTKTLF